MFKTIKKCNNQKQLNRKLSSYAGWLKYCNSKHLLYTIEI